MDRHQSSSNHQIPLSTLHRQSPFLKKLDKLTTFDISNIFQPRLGPRLPRLVSINLPLPNTAWKSDKHNQPIIGKPLPSWLYPSNQIRTAKYSLITFIPRNLLEQFRRIANVFFLILVILQFIPKFSQVSPILACLPLLVVLGVTAAKDAYEDVKRHQADSNTNKQVVHILRSSASSPSSDYLNPNLTQPKQSPFKFKWLQRKPEGNKDAALLASELQPQASIPDGPTIVKKHWWDRKVKVSKSPDKLEKLHTGHSSLPSRLDRDLQSPVSLNRPHDHHQHREVKFRRSAWEDLRVGDLVRLRNDEAVPADIIICSTSDEEENVCFIETKNLDGETNLKSRHAIKELSHLRSVSDCLKTQDPRNRFVIESEAPDPNLFKYNAALIFPEIKPNSVKSQSLEPTEKSKDGHDALRVAVNLNTMLLRGTVVRNTDWVIGVVVFTGPDTKIMMNSSGTPSKRSKVERLMNPMVFINLGILALMCLFNGIGTHLSERYYYDRNSYWTVYSDSSDDNPNINGAVGFANAMITYQNIVPISLYISIEFVRTMQALFIWADDHLYYRPTKKRTIARSWNLSDDLGQIQYIFSDKTGTLTQNLMQFRQCCIGGKVYSGIDRLGPIVEEDEDETVAVTSRSLSTGSSDSTGPKLKKKASEPSVINSADPEVTELPTIEPFQDIGLINDLSDPKSDQARLIHSFFATLGLCHTVLATEDETGTIQYKAQSPDESALVQAAADVGFVFRGRERNVLRLQVPSDLAKTRTRNTEINEFELLEVNEFTSARKRMSVVVRRLDSSDGRTRTSTDGLPTGEIFLLVKGADNVIFERLGSGQDEIKKKTDDQLEEFADQGLRTLCLACRQLKEDEFLSWSSKYTTACSQVGPEREKDIEAVQDELEHSLHLLGATAIEDKLQDGVPETIAELKRAGIKVWVATGDKLETAVAIARSCNLIAKDMNLIVIRGGAYGTRSSTYSQMRKALVDFFDADELVENLKEMPPDYVMNSERRPSRFSTHSQAQPGEEPIDLHDIVGEDNGNRQGGYGLVIDGASLHHAFEEAFTKEILLELSTRCQAVVCCRTSPKQKAEIVSLVKDGTNSMTLAIGDGANDVSMIQAADIGIGVSGEEGLQAVNSSDYAIGQFRYLSRLLFVHGHWSYDRNSRMILNFFYKEIIGISVLWFFQFWCAYSTTTYYEYTYLLFYNVFWTLLPVLGIGIFDQDIRQRVLVSVPELYSVGRDGKLFGLKNFAWYMAQGIYQGAVCYFFISFAYDTTSPRSDGIDVNINEVSTVVIVAVIIACNAFHALNQFAWNTFMTVFVLVGPVLIVLYTAVYSAFKPSFIWTTVYGNNYYLWAAPYWWFGILFTVVLCLLPGYLVKYYREMYHPTDLEILRYIDRIDPEHDYKTDPQMPYLRELSKYDNNEGGRPMIRKQPTHSSLEPSLARVERTRTSISVTHDMATGQASPSGVGRGFGFDQADGVGEIAVGNRLRRFNSSRLSIPEATPQRGHAASNSRDRSRSIRIGNLEIGAGGVRIGSPRNSHGHNSKLAKRISDFIHHPRPKSSGSDHRTRISDRPEEETDESQRRTGEGLSVILDPPTEDLEPRRELNQSTNQRNPNRLSSGLASNSLNPPSFPSLNSSMVLSDRHDEEHEEEDTS
ncbi:putative aminophspholipid translocase [Melampsora larici-populina 98AG31]|uniref:Phospholipid-transporting ATPase n=1 Tax=Melampsora larici-populina (strain 98AG31 / pathotype 3-4-7) TaxID=747676 RepID=F4S555_MELLP|nr:putative aminophspholipid translocase [Melampsora larici-populina 98AG31]EGG00267.1 putative aminophspholipid translocase [Melampsora larici-populina 98AG31]